MRNVSFSRLFCRFVVSVGLFCGVSFASAESKSIFSIEPSVDGDFENVTVEPDSIDLKMYINQTFEAIRAKNEKILEFNKKTEKTVSDLNKSTKDSIDGTKSKIREFLGKNKSEAEEESSATKASESHGEPNVESATGATIQVAENGEAVKPLTKSEVKKIESENASIPNRQKFISYCLDNLRGYPYVTGGSSPKTGFDCSGVVQYAARESLGVKLPRTAQAMYNSSKKVSADEALPGDLIFFKAGGKISHVGVYLGTDGADDSFKGKVIFFNSASDPKYRSGTIISSLSEPYWKRHFFGYGKFIE